jgi:MOSC domain-containing protein YiiM
MAHWKSEFFDKADFFVPGCFGENISTLGLTEENLCLGDVLTMGTAEVQVCQGRQPCWKLNAHTGIDKMAPSFQRSGRTGWYYRVIKTGQVKTGDEMRLIERTEPDWSLSKLIQARFDPKVDPLIAKELSENPLLSEAWRQSFAKKIDRSFVENTDARLKG